VLGILEKTYLGLNLNGCVWFVRTNTRIDGCSPNNNELLLGAFNGGLHSMCYCVCMALDGFSGCCESRHLSVGLE
jgi:hypothetical protein